MTSNLLLLWLIILSVGGFTVAVYFVIRRCFVALGDHLSGVKDSLLRVPLSIGNFFSFRWLINAEQPRIAVVDIPQMVANEIEPLNTALDEQRDVFLQTAHDSTQRVLAVLSNAAASVYATLDNSENNTDTIIRDANDSTQQLRATLDQAIEDFHSVSDAMIWPSESDEFRELEAYLEQHKKTDDDVANTTEFASNPNRINFCASIRERRPGTKQQQNKNVENLSSDDETGKTLSFK